MYLSGSGLYCGVLCALATHSYRGSYGTFFFDLYCKSTSLAASKLAPYRPQHRLHPLSAQGDVVLETLVHLRCLEKVAMRMGFMLKEKQHMSESLDIQYFE